jgi:phenylacetate-CoA ligase
MSRLAEFPYRLDGFFRRTSTAYTRWADPYTRLTRELSAAPADTAWQLRELNRLLARAARHVPAHARKFRAAGVRLPLASLDELQSVPFMTKDELRAHPDEFVATDHPVWLRQFVTSGGTTGTPTRFATDARSYDRTFDAWRHFLWSHAGFTPSARTLDLTWAFTDEQPLRAAPETNRTFLSLNELTPARTAHWRDAVAQLAPEFIVAFPSSAAAFAQLIDASSLASVRAVILGSENITAAQTNVLRTAFPRARIFPWYGLAEMAGFTSGCEHSDAHHHWPRSGVLELIDNQNRPVTTPGRSGEIVLTGLSNRVTPFIRYRTGDTATLGEPCTRCARPHTLLSSLDGRRNDVLFAADGRMIPLSALNFHSAELDRVFAHQFMQEKPGAVRLLIVARDGFSTADETAIARLFRDRLGSECTLTLERVAEIARTPRGKQPLIVQRCRPTSTLS